jgi:hypothetical protein
MLPASADARSPKAFGRLITSVSAERLEAGVRVQDQILQTVVFLGVENAGQFSPVATGFLGSLDYREHTFMFLITADHVLDLIGGDSVSVRANRKLGDATVFRIPKARKFVDSNNDIAVFPLPWPHDAFDQKRLHLDREKRRQILKLSDDFFPGVGDEVATVGLYTTHQGETRNIPIVRIGNIARLPHEPVRSTRGFAKAYLVETRSIVGLSGSPVLLNLPEVWIDNNRQPHFLHGKGRGAYPVGMMLGYHLVGSTEDQIQVTQEARAAGLGPLTADERNTGLAVVIPFERILDVIERDEVRQLLDRAVDERLATMKVRPTGAISPSSLAEAAALPATDENPNHREDFERLVGLAAKAKPDSTAG